MAKVISIFSRQPINWSTWLLKKRPCRETKESRIKMTQHEVWAIFLNLIAAESPGQAFEFLKSEMKTRRHVTYWLGQIGHRQDARLGAGKDFLDYMRAVSNSLWCRSAGL
jgi:hypothetical protein